MSDHTAKAFDLDLQELRKMIAEMGGLTERQIMDTPLANRSVLDLAILIPNVSGEIGRAHV